MAEDPFKVFESASAPGDSSRGHFVDPLEEISKFSSSGSTKNDSSSTSNGKVYEDIDPFDGLGKSVPAFSSERSSKKGSSSPRLNTNSSWNGDKEPFDKISGRSPERDTKSKTPAENDREFPQAPFHMPTYSSDSDKPVGKRSTSPPYNNVDFRQANIQADMSPKYEDKLEPSEDIWLTVSEIPLFTQPTTAHHLQDLLLHGQCIFPSQDQLHQYLPMLERRIMIFLLFLVPHDSLRVLSLLQQLEGYPLHLSLMNLMILPWAEVVVMIMRVEMVFLMKN